MCRNATFFLLLGLNAALAAPVQPEWRHIGNSAIDLGLPSLATGAVERVWYSPDGTTLFARTAPGTTFETNDFEQWKPAPAVAPPPMAQAAVPVKPEPAAQVRMQAAAEGRYYAFAAQVYRSDDGGLTWSNLTASRGESILGGAVNDVAVSPVNPDEVVAANAYGVWRSMDAGASWEGLNDFLPNLSIRKLLQTPSGTEGLIAWARPGELAIEWAPGEKTAWQPVASNALLAADVALRASLSRTLGTAITAAAAQGDSIYAGSADGRLWASSDQGRTWRSFGSANAEGPVSAIFTGATNPRVALAAIGATPSGGRAVHLRRTTNAGLFWDDLTSNLPDVPANGVAADLPTGVVYAATAAGVYYTAADLNGAGPATPWTRLDGLPDAAAEDVRLGVNHNRLWVAVAGYGVYSTLAPHRFLDPKLVNAADETGRPAAPGSLLSLLGARAQTAQSPDGPAPVLNNSGADTQIQVPFSASGDNFALNLTAGNIPIARNIALKTVSPAIFVDPDGTPMLLDADSGVFLDAMRPAHSGAHVQILATGLGRVKPDWPTGLAAPVQNPPKVEAEVHAYLDGQPVTVTNAELAPGYVGFYLVEIELPRIVNYGPAQLYLEAGGQQSNAVRIYIEP
jgi:uncharacterized protein (TIGR03437 family)